MEINFDIEYIDKDGDDQYIEEVEVFGEPRWENDSFSYAGTHCTGGVGGIHHLPSYTVLDSDVTWDKSRYTPEENSLIQKWINAHISDIEEAFCLKLEKESEKDY